MYYTARTQEAHHEEVLKLLQTCKASGILWCKEDTGNNPHYHYLFESPLEVSTMRTHRQKSNVPKGQQNLVLKEIQTRFQEDYTVKDVIHRYKLYMCKGYDVSSKALYAKVKDGVYIGKPPVTHGFYLGETEKLHKEFWETYHKMRILGNDKSKGNTGTSRFISYLEEHLKIERDSDEKNDSTEKYLRIRYKDIILNQVISLAYHYCRKMDKSCIETVVKNLVSAGLNRFDDTGLFFKYETRNMEDYFIERMR